MTKDTRIFATSKGAVNSNNEPVIHIEDEPKTTFKGKFKVTKHRNPRRYLRPVYVLLLFIEWLADMVTQIIQIVHNSIKDITLALETYINESNSPPTETD